MTLVLDRVQLREVTLEDEELMRQILAALIEDTEKQLPLLGVAIRNADRDQCARLAHYCKGACANVGAKAAATSLRNSNEPLRPERWRNAPASWPHSPWKWVGCAKKKSRQGLRP